MKRISGGFTLIEVMVALFIVGVALPAMVGRMQGIVENTITIDEKTYAYWIAENKLQELQLTQEMQQSITRSGKQQDNLEYGGREWIWVSEVISTAVPEIFRLEIKVGLAESEDETLASLIGFIYQRSTNTGTSSR